MKKIVLDIVGMHCVSCAMNIDGELEEMEAIKNCTTNYAKSQTTVEFEEGKITQQDIIDNIKKVGYTATLLIDA